MPSKFRRSSGKGLSEINVGFANVLQCIQCTNNRAEWTKNLLLKRDNVCTIWVFSEGFIFFASLYLSFMSILRHTFIVINICIALVNWHVLWPKSINYRLCWMILVYAEPNLPKLNCCIFQWQYQGHWLVCNRLVVWARGVCVGVRGAAIQDKFGRKTNSTHLFL